MNETSHWLICEEGLKSRCTALIQNSDVTEGCWGTNVADLDNLSASVLERWRSTQIEKPVVEDYFNNLDSIPGSILYSYNHHKKTYSREKSQEITKFLKTCEELLRDDFGYSLKAVQTFTVQLMDIIEERNKRNSYRVGREKFESNIHLGCTPRPQMCWLFRDQLARLWRLLVLNPSISAKDREEIFTTLEVLEAKLHSNDGKKQYLEWDSPKHIQHLKSFTWESLRLSEDPFKTDDPSDISVVNSAVIECNVQRSTTVQFPDPAEQFPLPIELSCGDFSSSVTVYCYLVEALSVYGKTEQAVHLAMNLALAVVRYYSTWLEGSLHVNTQNTLWVDYDEKQENEAGKKGKGGRKKRQNRKRGRAGSKKTDEENEKTNEMLFDQIKGIIPITSIAYLMDLLEQNQDLLAEMLKLVKLRGLGLSEEELMECDDVTSDAKSLIFRLGVVGLGMPKIQAPSLQIQVEWFNWEVFVSQKLMQFTPSTGDVEFMKMFIVRLIDLCEFGFHPPHALVMNLFQHSYKPAANQFDDGVSVAMRTIVASPWKQSGVNIHRRTFLECLRRHWVKLCEIVLCRVSVSAPQLSHALECLFTATNMIGTTCEDFNVKPGKKVSGRNKKSTQNAENLGKKTSNALRNTKLVQGMLIEKVVANLYLAYALVSHAGSLTTTTDAQSLTESEKQSAPKHKRVVGYVIGSHRRAVFPHRVTTVEEVKKSSAQLTEQQKSLYETAITLASRAFAVKNFTFHQLQMESFNYDYNFLEFMQRSLKWMCTISGKIGVKAFDLILERQRLHCGPVKCFSDDEVIKICTTMLESEQKREELVWMRVRDALLTLMRPQSDMKISDILTLCRTTEKEPSSKRVLLVPAICKELLLYIPGSSLDENSKVEHLARTMVTMHTLCKKLESDDVGESLEGVKELFSESTTDKPGTSDGSSKQESLDPNLQLCFDLAIETIKHVNDSYRVRSFEVRRTYENACDVVTYVAKKASKPSEEDSEEAMENAKIPSKKTDPYAEVYVNRFIEVLCNHVQDYLLLTDFFFELSSRLLALPQHASFGRDRVLLSDDLQLGLFCQSCSTLSVLLKRCITGLVETTQGEEMEKYMKESVQDSTGYCKARAKNAKFYCGASLVSFLEVLKRLMSISPDDDFEPFSYKLASKHPILKTAIEESSNKSSSSPHEEVMFSENHLISSLLLRRMFSPALSFFDYDEDGWRY